MELCHSSWFILWVDSTGSYLLNSVHLVSSVQVDSLPFQEELVRGALSFSQAIF